MSQIISSTKTAANRSPFAIQQDRRPELTQSGAVEKEQNPSANEDDLYKDKVNGFSTYVLPLHRTKHDPFHQDQRCQEA